ncbi:MAG: D-2-hydroxyacid dehydrogenase [Chloroflexi bacterium]|nr:D-2-hydroxyacid dehydrogenase [Chloroflexota bacterium]
MNKLLILSRFEADYRRLVEAANLPGLKIASGPDKDCSIILGEPKLIRDALPNLPSVQWVQSIFAGVEQLLDPSLQRDYVLTNARGVFGALMSEYVFGYLLAHERHIFERSKAQQENRWETKVTGQLRGKTIGLLGVGSIGAHLAGTAKHFQMNTRGYTRDSKSCPDVDQYFHNDQLLEFAKGLDYLVSVLPNTKETNHIVDMALLNALPPHAVFINVGRGSAVDEAALAEALNAGKIALAILDVFEQEPLPKDHFFWHTKNLWMTFHTSAPSIPEDIMRLFAENYDLFLRGKPLKCQVDFRRGY